MAIADLEARMQLALDRQEIGDMLNVYWRAVDRCEGAAHVGRHPETTDGHGACSGKAPAFASYIVAQWTAA